MAERLPSDHPTVASHRTRLVRSGGARRPALALPEAVAAAVAEGDRLRVVVDGRECHARVGSGADGPLLRGAYDDRRRARERDGPNRLREWAADAGLGPGDAVELDELLAGDLYGLRAPGERVVYSVTRTPPDSLAEIARDVDGDGRDS